MCVFYTLKQFLLQTSGVLLWVLPIWMCSVCESYQVMQLYVYVCYDSLESKKRGKKSISVPELQAKLPCLPSLHLTPTPPGFRASQFKAQYCRLWGTIKRF